MSAPTDNSGESIVPVTGSLTVSTVEEVRMRLVAALAAASTVIIDLTAATEIDLYGVQLLCAAQRSAGLRGQRLQLRQATSLVEAACAAVAIKPAAVGLLPVLSSP